MRPNNADRILVVDDDAAFLRLLTLHLNSLGYDTECASSAAQAFQLIASFKPALVITDLRMEGMDGIGLLDEVRKHYPGLPVVLVTAHGTIPDAVSATHSGAFGFLTKPVHKGELRETISSALKISSSADTQSQWCKDIVHRSHLMSGLLRTAQIVARTDTCVLLSGDVGTGKKLLARNIHKISTFAQGEFKIISCAETTQAEINQLLNPQPQRPGDQITHNKSVGHGSLLLENIDQLSPALQFHLLELLTHTDSHRDQQRDTSSRANTYSQGAQVANGVSQFRSDTQVAAREQGRDPAPNHAPNQMMGGGSVQSAQSQPIKRWRLLATSCADLADAVESNRFRQDLYYHLRVVELKLPKLAERREDIPSLADFFLVRHANAAQVKPKSLSPAAIDAMALFPWPGNVGQLESVVEQCAVLTTGPVITETTVREVLGEPDDALPSFAEARDTFTKSYLTRLMTLTDGNVSRAARLAKRNRTEFYKLLARFSVEPSRFKPGKHG